MADEIVREAREKASGIFEAARREARGILDSARSALKEREEQLMAEARARGKGLYEEMLARDRMKAKREILERREEIIDEVFKEAEKELQAYAESEKYKRDLVRIAIGACKGLGSEEVVIYANKRDLEFFKKSWEELTRKAGVKISLGEPIRTIGGIRVGTPDKKMEVDATFEGKMRREFGALRTKMAKVLFEGS